MGNLIKLGVMKYNINSMYEIKFSLRNFTIYVFMITQFEM